MKLTDLKGMFAGTKQTKYPTKTTINMAACGRTEAAGKTLVIGMAVIAVLVLLVVKFCVFDQYARLSRAEADYNSVYQKNQELADRVSDYDEVMLEYRAYSMSFISNKNDENFVGVDRKEVLDLIETVMMKRGQVLSIEIYENTAKVSMKGMNLEEISEMIRSLKNSPVVSEAQLNIAKTDENKPASVLSFSVTIYLQQEQEAE
mgnify:FL=1